MKFLSALLYRSEIVTLCFIFLYCFIAFRVKLPDKIQENWLNLTSGKEQINFQYQYVSNDFQDIFILKIINSFLEAQI